MAARRVRDNTGSGLGFDWELLLGRGARARASIQVRKVSLTLGRAGQNTHQIKLKT